MTDSQPAAEDSTTNPVVQQDNQEQTPPHYDVAIAGGGLAGVLAAIRLNALNPELKIGLWEEEPHLGGRGISGEGEKYSYGQTVVTEEFYQFFCEAAEAAGLTSQSEPQSEPQSGLESRPCEMMTVLSQSTLKPVEMSQLIDTAGIKTIGGNVAVKEWQQWLDLDKAETAGKALSKALNLPRKGALATVMNVLAPLLGMTEFWETDGIGLDERLQRFKGSLVQVDWDLAWPGLLQYLHSRGVAIHLGCPLLSCDWQKGDWHITSKEQSDIKAQKLIVAVNPWDALDFIGKKHLPTPINQLVSRGKPVSLVTMTVIPKDLPEDFPKWSLIPAEKTSAILQPSGQLTFQVAIDFEKYLDAPSVVKAIKKLRRSHKKLFASFPDLELGKEHIALVPVGWACSLGFKDRKIFTKLAEGAFEKDHLYFVGDAYGQSSVGEVNIKQSVLRACSRIQPHLG